MYCMFCCCVVLYCFALHYLQFSSCKVLSIWGSHVRFHRHGPIICLFTFSSLLNLILLRRADSPVIVTDLSASRALRNLIGNQIMLIWLFGRLTWLDSYKWSFIKSMTSFSRYWSLSLSLTLSNLAPSNVK